MPKKYHLNYWYIMMPVAKLSRRVLRQIATNNETY